MLIEAPYAGEYMHVFIRLQSRAELAAEECAAVERLRGSGVLPDIADDLGFSDESAFARAFRRWTGLTPAQFRRQRNVKSHDPSAAAPPARQMPGACP
jgi:AraC-like DNA-binding protein